MTRRSVLIVDDDAHVRDALVLGLTDHGYNAHAVADLAAVLAELERRTPHILISDMQTPCIPDAGIIRRVRELWARLPIIAMSGGGETEMSSLAAASGANAFVAKPFRAIAMAHHVEQLLTQAA